MFSNLHSSSLFFLLAPNLDANHPLSLTLLHHPPIDLTPNSFQSSFNLEEVENAMKERISVTVDGLEMWGMDSASKMESRVGHLGVE